MAEWKGGFLKSLKSGVHGTGAAAGWSWKPTAKVTMRTADVSIGGCRVDAIVLTGYNDTDETSPCEPGEFAECADTSETEGHCCADNDEDGSASCMVRYGIEADGDADEGGGGAECVDWGC